MAQVEGSTHLQGLAAGASIKKAVTVAATKTSGQIVTILNPENADLIIKRQAIHVHTQATAALSVDVGTGAATSTDASQLFSGLSGLHGAPADTIYKANLTTTEVIWKAGQWLNVTVASGDANGLVADFYTDYQLLSGGNPFT